MMQPVTIAAIALFLAGSFAALAGTLVGRSAARKAVATSVAFMLLATAAFIPSQFPFMAITSTFGAAIYYLVWRSLRDRDNVRRARQLAPKAEATPTGLGGLCDHGVGMLDRCARCHPTTTP